MSQSEQLQLPGFELILWPTGPLTLLAAIKACKRPRRGQRQEASSDADRAD